MVHEQTNLPPGCWVLAPLGQVSRSVAGRFVFVMKNKNATPSVSARKTTMLIRNLGLLITCPKPLKSEIVSISRAAGLPLDRVYVDMLFSWAEARTVPYVDRGTCGRIMNALDKCHEVCLCKESVLAYLAINGDEDGGHPPKE